MRIAVVAPACPVDAAIISSVDRIAAEFAGLELYWHPQCLMTDGHFAGNDQVRADAFVEVANDPSIDAVWFARGGYGACRITREIVGQLTNAAWFKTYLGYSDMGFLLSWLCMWDIGWQAHGPMPADVRRTGGEDAVRRSLRWLVHRDRGVLEPSVSRDGGCFAFNLTVLASMMGTSMAPVLSGHVLMLEDVDEPLYRIDRALFQITTSEVVEDVLGIRRGRLGATGNDRPFGADEEAIFRYWCDRSGIPYLGTADIGHDADNKVVPFGRTQE